MAAFPPPLPSPAIAAAVIRATAAYILTGALAKVFWGSPSDLPAALLEAMWWDPQGLFQLVIAIELVAAVIALISPKLGWPAVGAVLVGFILVLLQQLLLGQTSCGCFGEAVVVPIWAMMPLDALVLATVVVVRPWSSLHSTPWRLWSLAPPPLVVAVALWYVHAATLMPDPVVPRPADSGNLHALQPDRNGEFTMTTKPASTPEVDPIRDGHNPPTTSMSDSVQNTQTPDDLAVDAASSDTGWRLPARFPRYVILHPDRWIGRRLSETPLATWVDVGRFPSNATLIFYYDTCDHCAAHLKELASHPDVKTSYVLIQLPTSPSSRYPKVVYNTPPGLHVKLPAGPKWQIQTPWDVIISDGIVTDAIKGF